jgi:putative ABC transport system permease protein
MAVDPQQQPAPRAAQARTWRRYLRFFGPRGAADLDDELAFHVEMRVRDYVARGMTEAEARAATLNRLGDLARARDACAAVTQRTERRMTRTFLIDSMMQDLRFALRTLHRNAGWTAVAVTTLALGIGANTAMFSVVNHLLLNPLPYPHADRVAVLFQQPSAGSPSGHNVMITPSTKLIRAWREQARSFEAIEPYLTTDLTLERPDRAARVVHAASVLPSFAAFAGERPEVGRMFTDAEARGEASVALVSEGFWRTEFGSDTAVVGRPLTLNGKPVTIIGVMPEAFRLPRTTDGEIDLVMPLDLAKHQMGLLTITRLREGASAATANRELDAIAAAADPESTKRAQYRSVLKSPAEMVGFRDSLVLLTVAVALVLLIACANVTHLLLARASTRQRELAIRAALGAGNRRLFRQLLTESMLLSAAGCLGGLLIGWFGLRVLIAARPDNLADLASVRMDGTTLAVTGAIAVITALVFGVVGAIQASRHATHEALKAGALTTSGSRGRARSVLVITEMALCTMLLVGATLLLRSVMHLQGKDPGFDPRGLYALELSLPEERYATDASKRAFDSEVVQRARALPEVADVMLVASAPPGNTFLIGALHVEGQPPPAAGTTELLRYNGVAPGFFQMMGMRIVEGTTFTDTSSAASQIVINQGMARKLWGTRSPLGSRMRVVYNGTGEWRTVVGVVADASLSGLTSPADEPIFYGSGVDIFRPALLVRATADARFIPALAGILSSIDPRLPPAKVTSIQDALYRSVARPRFTMFLLGIFALVAVGLAAIGLYGVLAYNVAQRTREIGIRIALGAPRGVVARLVLSQAVLMAGVGAVIGLLAARGGGTLVSKLLYGVQQTDPISFAMGGGALVAIALLACIVPVRRALSIDPQIAMRAD